MTVTQGRRARTTIDLAEWKREHPLHQVVSRIINRPVRPGGNIHCPFHADKNPSLTVWADGRWRCWSCGRHGDVYDFLGYVWYGDGYDLRQVIDRLGEIAPTVPLPAQRTIHDTPRLRPALPGELVEQFEARVTSREIGYWERQGIPSRVQAYFSLGWTGRRHVIPWLYRGVLTAMKLRRDDDLTPHLEPKYLSMRGSRYAAPYNIDTALRGWDTVLIVEDEKSVWAAWACGLVAIASPAGSFRPEWASLLLSVSDIVIIPDNDSPGLAAAERILCMLGNGRVARLPGGYSDLFDYHRGLWVAIQDRETVAAEIRRLLR